jgi:hypothetical protein
LWYLQIKSTRGFEEMPGLALTLQVFGIEPFDIGFFLSNRLFHQFFRNLMRVQKFTFSFNLWSCCLALLLSLASIGTSSAQCTLVCDDLVNISLDQDCQQEILPDMVLEGGGCPGGTLRVQARINNVWVPSNPLVNGNFVATSAHIGQTLQLRVRDFSVQNGNFCTGFALIEDKLAPSITCADITVNCATTEYEPEDLFSLGIAAAFPTASDNCSGVSRTWSDTWFDLPCNSAGDFSARVLRRWTVTDASGNTNTCEQNIYFDRIHVLDLDLPDDITIQCDEFVSSDPTITGTPTFTQFGVTTSLYPNTTFCELNATFTDQTITVCPGTRKILRTWVLFDWCLPNSPNNPTYHVQLIKIADEVGPEIACPEDMTVSTNPSQCCAFVNLPDVLITDNCGLATSASAMVIGYDQYTGEPIGTFNVTGTIGTYPGDNQWDNTVMGRYGTTTCLPIGTHTVVYMAQDNCGTTSSCSFQLTILDETPPAVSCTSITTVAVGYDDPNDCYEPSDACEFGGVQWIKASVFDQGSTDNCNGVDFTIRRMAPYSQCIEDLKDLCDLNGDGDDDDEYYLATGRYPNLTEEEWEYGQDSIKFYCCEVGTTQTIILRVYQTNLNGQWMTYSDGSYIYDECMIQVTVQDKLKPTCQAPNNVTVTCGNFDPSLWAYGQPIVEDNCCLDESYSYQGQCGLSAWTDSYASTGFDTTCNRGTIVRRFRVYDCHGQSSTCSQRIVVNYAQDYTVKMPNDVTLNCTPNATLTPPLFTNDEGCELLGYSFDDQVFTVVPDACYKIERTWQVINWCSYNPNLPCSLVNNPENSNTGPTVTVNAGNPQNCLVYKQIIKVVDQNPPSIQCSVPDTCDVSTNDPRYWRDGDLWWENATMSHDLCEKEMTLSASGSDLCGTTQIPAVNLKFRYLLFLDLDGDAVMETVVSSTNPPPAGRIWYNNIANTANNYGGGGAAQVRIFDQNQLFRFGIRTNATGSSAQVWWTGGAGKLPELPHGKHKIKWIVEDGCGNEAVCEYSFHIKDCKPPVVACENININLMVGGMAVLWANDFFEYGNDNCTPEAILYPTLAVIRADENPTNTFPADLPQGITVTCDDEGTDVPVQVWLQDAAGNADFCIAYVNVQANIVGCDGGNSAAVAGKLATEEQQGIEQAAVEMAMGAGMTASQTTGDNGTFSMAMPLASNLTITPTKDDNSMNGLSTYDLVLISKHILGIEPLGSPYKMIAADANRSGSITTFDIVEFRKLILGIYNELPNNTSWRFVDEAYMFPNPDNPFQDNFPENISINNLSGNMMANDFVGIKIGDVNGTVIANSLLGNIEERSDATLYFSAEDRMVSADEVFTVQFNATEKVQGYQFTLNFEGLEVLEVLPGANMGNEHFARFDKALTMAVENEAPTFGITFRASKNGALRDMLAINSRITKAESYALSEAGQAKVMGVALRFNNATAQNPATSFELYQNQPNPVGSSTNISFFLPEAGEATLTISTVEGRQVKRITGSYAKGLNTISIQRSDLEAGVLFYELATDKQSAVKKMIVP